MNKSNFRPKGANASRRNVLKVDRFLGVDYSSQKLEMLNGRAIDLKNYIFKDGVIQKRNGFEEIFEIKPFNYVKENFDNTLDTKVSVNGVNFNGIWSFLAEDKKRHIIAHIGKLLYEITNIESERDIKVKPFIIKNDVEIGGHIFPSCYEYENFKSQAFVGENKLWFLGGNKFMCIRFLINSDGINETRVTPVENFAYVPTTTINITKTNSKVGGRADLDKVNLLSKMRINKLLSGTPKEEALKDVTKYNEYVLSSPLIVENEGVDMTNFSITIEERGEIDNEKN